MQYESNQEIWYETAFIHQNQGSKNGKAFRKSTESL